MTSIESHDLENVFTNRKEAVSSNLQIISSAKSVQDNELEKAQTLFNAAQNSTSNLTNFYMWLDDDGRIWCTNNSGKGATFAFSLPALEP